MSHIYKIKKFQYKHRLIITNFQRQDLFIQHYQTINVTL